MKYFCVSSPERSWDTFVRPVAELAGAPWPCQHLYFEEETNVFPPRETMSQHIESCRSFGFDPLECTEGLSCLSEKENLAQILKVGGDSSGAAYYISSRTMACYVWWHDPDEIERVTDDPARFLVWMIERQPEHPPGCKWTTFIEIPCDLAFVPLAHAKRFSVDELCERACVFGEFPVSCVTDSVAKLLQPQNGLLIHMAHDLRGFRTSFHLTAGRKLLLDPEFASHARSFVQWLNDAGFCHPDTPSVRGLDDPPLPQS